MIRFRTRLFAASITLAAATVSHGEFFEGFDSGLPFAEAAAAPGVSVALASGEWHILNLSDPIGFTSVFQGSPFVFPAYEGPEDSYAAMNYFSGGAAGANLSVFLMSPVSTFDNGDVITFHSRTTDDPATWPDRLRLVLSSAGASTDAADFSTVLLTINESLSTTGYPAEWTEYSVTLSGLAGPTSGRFAFHYDVPNGGPGSVNSNYVGIDSVSLVPSPAVAAALALGGLFARRRR